MYNTKNDHFQVNKLKCLCIFLFILLIFSFNKSLPFIDYLIISYSNLANGGGLFGYIISAIKELNLESRGNDLPILFLTFTFYILFRTIN